MSSLEQRQKECRLYVDRIGDILDTHMSNMAAYMVRSAHVVRRQILTGMQEYCVNQSNAIKVLQTLREGNPQLAEHLQVSSSPHHSPLVLLTVAVASTRYRTSLSKS